MTVYVRPHLSPRLIQVPTVDGDEISAQDAHDQMKAWEERPENMGYERLVLTTGKDDLGGGTFTGLNLQLQDAQMEFESNTTPIETGTVTTANAAGNTLIDSAATFVTNGVKRGDWIVNFTDQSVTSVLTVDSEVQLTTVTLEAGTDNDYDMSDAYAVFGITQKDLNGGNFLAVDADGLGISSVYTSFGNQVIRTASSSATLQEQTDIQFSSFGGGVTVDVLNGTAGTTFPTGTPRQPVDNVMDGVTIAQARGFRTLFIVGNVTLGSGDVVTDFEIIGQSHELTSIVVDAAASAVGVVYKNADLSGTLDDDSKIEDCHVDAAISITSGEVIGTVLGDTTITLAGSTEVDFINCWSGVAGTGTPVIDMGGTGQALTVRNFNGGIQLQNKSGADAVSIDLNSGQCKLASSITGGTIVVRGVGKLIETDGTPIRSGNFNGATILNEITTPETVVYALKTEVFDVESFETIINRLKSFGYGKFIETSEGVVDFYDDAGTSVLFTLTRTEAAGLTTRTVS